MKYESATAARASPPSPQRVRIANLGADRPDRVLARAAHVPAPEEQVPHEDERVGVLRLGLQRGARPALGVVDAAAREVRIAEGDERRDVFQGQRERLGQELDGAIVAIRVPLDGGEAAEGRGVRWIEATGRGNMLPRLARPPVRGFIGSSFSGSRSSMAGHREVLDGVQR
ncbi:hypothetical protein WME96_08070 [Sorangium sp. So ce406]